jgi:hypothetical protein
MTPSLHQQLLEQVPRRLADLVQVSAGKVRVREERLRGPGKDEGADIVIDVGARRFVIECKADGSAAPISAAARQAQRYAKKIGRGATPLVAVPFMGEVGKRLCAENGVSWLDLSGNARLEAPGLRVHIEGKPNRFKRRGRPASLFAPKSSRVARWLLIHPDRSFSQRALAQATGIGEGFVSRIVRGLEEHNLLAREPDGAVKVADFNAMLDAWREAYDFSKHHIVRGHIAARSSDEVLRQVAGRLKRDRIEYSATGLAGAWLLNQFSGFRLVVVYVARLPSAEAQRAMGFREESRGENVWLVVPNDEGVFHGAAEREGIRCVHPVQAYLDLKNHPERSAEAAEELRRRFLNKESDA